MKWINVNKKMPVPTECFGTTLLLRAVTSKGKIIKDSGFYEAYCGNEEPRFFWCDTARDGEHIEADHITHWIKLEDIPEPRDVK